MRRSYAKFRRSPVPPLTWPCLLFLVHHPHLCGYVQKLYISNFPAAEGALPCLLQAFPNLVLLGYDSSCEMKAELALGMLWNFPSIRTL